MSDICCYTIISRDLMLLRWAIENARARAGIGHEWLVVLWINPDEPEEPSRRIAEWCTGNEVRVVPFTAPLKADFPDRTSWFLSSLYRAWNLGYSESNTKWVARMGSDTFFSKGWLAKLMEAADAKGERSVFHTWCVESPIAKHSRHDIQDWGSTWQTFDLARFENYASEQAWRYQNQPVIPGDECNLRYFHPARGAQTRPDSCTWLMTKALWQQYGPMKDHVNNEGVSGDVSFMDTLTDAGIKQYLVMNSILFHLVRGESRGIQQ